ncbi:MULTISPECIES: DUF4294 domain-containing protein [unclassified Olleya]|jgi:hypothetical protein|uniref:DUF4294 domain-containing protein n=1 Tax=unclassified Olleya TaxID=2615019 RepID=UPI00119CEFD2|nr:DUF4294 domain-containing protein [Olleya sp. Hel_I_94]TVZ46286.1 uncharacterized protein DUF4294 [Olleya sp. Hel_I_94]
MKYILFILLCIPTLLVGQEVNIIEQDSTEVEYIIIEGDSIPQKSIYLDEVMILDKLSFKSKEDRRRYLILGRKTLKVYPYAKLAADRLNALNTRLQSLDRKRDKKKYAKKVQKYIEEEFSEELKKLTRTEGQILVKLIHRQTGKTTFDLIKELRSGWRAFWFNSTAYLFNISLKREYDPENVEEDYLIEDILIRAWQNGQLKLVKSPLDFEYFKLNNKWSKTE